MSSENTSSELTITGERYLPQQNGLIRFEHLHRYLVASTFVADKDVLDIACGEGYGSALMSKQARRVYGVDIDGTTIANAQKVYADHGNVSFFQGSCDSIPLGEHTVDVVVSFETIEHHDRHQEMLREIKRVLRPGGLLILSSPNKRVYTDAADYHNPFHIKELYRDELETLLNSHFRYVRLSGQQNRIGSFITPVEDESILPLPLLVEGEAGEVAPFGTDVTTMYYLALCSDSVEYVRGSVSSAFLSQADNTLAELQTYLNDREVKLVEAHRDLGEYYSRSCQLSEEKAALHETQRVLLEEIETLKQQKADLGIRLQETQTKLHSIENTRLWKLRMLLGRMARQAGVRK